MPGPGAPRDTAPTPTLDYHAPPPPPLARPVRRRRWIGTALLAIGAAAAASAPLLDHEPLRTNVATAGAGFILWGLVLRFGPARSG